MDDADAAAVAAALDDLDEDAGVAMAPVDNDADSEEGDEEEDDDGDDDNNEELLAMIEENLASGETELDVRTTSS